MTHPVDVGIRDVPKIREYWYLIIKLVCKWDDTMHKGVPRKLSGGNSSLRRARTKERAEMTRDAARVT